MWDTPEASETASFRPTPWRVASGDRSAVGRASRGAAGTRAWDQLAQAGRGMIPTRLTLKTPPDLLAPLVGWGVALGILSHQVAKGHLAWLDHGVASWMASCRSPALDGPVRVITFFGSSLWTFLALCGLGVLAWRRGGTGKVLILIGALGVSLVFEMFLRYSVSSWRPDALGSSEGLDWFTRFRLAGYPSGHALRSAFVFGWVIRECTRLRGAWTHVLEAGCWVLIALVGLTRLYLNRHWASDVVGGWLVVLVVMAIARCWEERRSLQR